MEPKKRKKAAVRMMEQLVRMTIRSSAFTIMSENETGRLASSLQDYLRMLNKLAESDPEGKFWSTLHRVNLRILRHLLAIKR
jgi:ABC-type uncharacterized transport system fused permease/ATPase subunit